MADEAALAPRWRVNKRELLLGVCLVLFSVFPFPVLLNVRLFHVPEHMYRALTDGDPTELLSAAFSLVALNIVRGIPHYVGVFFIGESVEPVRSRIPKSVLSLILTFALLRLTYWGIEQIHHIRYDFGIPAVCVSLFAILFGTLNYRYISLSKKAMMITLALAPLQFLDIVPALRHLPVGRGETSTDVKLAAAILDAERLLNALGTLGLLLFLLFASLILKQLRDENVLRELATLREQNEEIRTQARISEFRSRTYEEIQYLVHDLKSPLTAIQTMADVMRMEREMEGDRRDDEYLDHILRSVSQIDRMVSEMRESIWNKGISGKGSSGLGLAFVRSVVERMDGELGLESRDGQGSTVTISLRQEGESQ